MERREGRIAKDGEGKTIVPTPELIAWHLAQVQQIMARLYGRAWMGE